MELRQLFTISTGYTFRDAIATMEPGNTAVVQAGDITAARLASVPRIAFDNPRHMLQAGDILISARGSVVARTVTPDLLPAIAASSVFVLRPILDDLNPRFVARYLNSAYGQAALRQIATGAYIKSLRKPDIASLQIPQPPVATQDIIVRLHDVIDENRKLLRLKDELLQQLDNSVINQLQGENQ